MSESIPRRASVFCCIMAVALGASLVACGPSKPSGAEYLGKWEAIAWHMGGSTRCLMDISRNGASFLIQATGGEYGWECRVYEGIFTLTPEGNLTGGTTFSMVVLSFDKETNRIAMSLNGRVQYLEKLGSSPKSVRGD